MVTATTPDDVTLIKFLRKITDGFAKTPELKEKYFERIDSEFSVRGNSCATLCTWMTQ